MRELKFRGLRVDDKRWFFGSMFTEKQKTIIRWIHNPLTNDYTDIEVKSETVGQFTGLQDKNGIDIYEGDILSDVVESDEGTILSKEKVFWNNKRGAWYLDESFKQDEYYSTELGYVLQNFDYEVIGNIHEK